ncbi:YadA family autotransporter adhesin, partial [Paraburkholderia sp. J41]|uniref:YadA family autotransporter adhesin n=1 Tax=Paraburkholderia sp. J41 TaxID=2805433 RepID=UPI002AC31BA6
VAAGVVGQSSYDAVNGGQLYGVASSTATALGGNTKVNSDGTLTSPVYDVAGGTYSNVGEALAAIDSKGSDSPNAVSYDTSAHDKLTLGGAGTTKGPVALTNVANGSLNASSVDAVNGSQLYALGAKTDGSGNLLNAFVAYDDTSMSKITLGGVGSSTPVALTNVANGSLNASSVDAVNGSQLYALGAKTDGSGNLLNAFVAYDDTSMNSVTFGGSMAHAPVQLHNVAAGVVGQLSTDAVNGGQLYGLASSTAAALGGGATVTSSGAISTPTYGFSDGTFTNVGEALAAIDAKATTGSVNGVVYDNDAHTRLTLGGAGTTNGPVALTNVANGSLNASSVDAVNGSQLYALGAKTDGSGNLLNAFVTYDDTSMSKITLGGVGATKPVTLTNVANGSLNASSVDAVNGSQLYALGAKTDGSGNLLNAFVAYDDTSMTSVTFGGAGHAPVQLHNVAAGDVSVSSTDAVNGGQLYAMGARFDTSGNMTNAFVMYDDTSMSSITLGGSTDHAPVVIHNVAGGSISASSTDAVNGTQLYNTASSTAAALGGGSTVSGDGTISAPTYNVGGNTFTSVGGAITNLDGRVTNIENTITSIAGDVTNIAGQIADAVQYDSSAHSKITLGGSNSTTPVVLTNVANGTLTATSTDAVNGAQLWATNQQVANLDQAIQNIGDTGSQFISTNTTSGPASATGSNSIAAGGGATASGANSTAMGDKASASGNNSTAMGANAAATGANSVAIGANSVADEDNTVSVGAQGSERRITNVANGVNATDAVNVGQLQSGLNQLQSGISSVARNAYGGVAAATALTMIPDVDQGKTIAIGVGTANYQGYQAVAMGASARITQNIKVKVGGGYSSGGGATVGGGMSYQW